MTDLVSAADKADMEAAIEDIHDTFSRDITIYKNEKEVFVAATPQFNSTYNALYQKLKNATGTKSKVSRYAVKARVQYNYKQETSSEAGMGAQMNIPLSVGNLRIKLNQKAYLDFKFATKIEIDGILWRIISDASRAGLFSPQYYVLFLERDE